MRSTQTSYAPLSYRSASRLVAGLFAALVLSAVLIVAPGCRHTDTTDNNANVAAANNDATSNNDASSNNDSAGNTTAAENNGGNAPANTGGNHVHKEGVCLLPPTAQTTYFDNIQVGDPVGDFTRPDIITDAPVSTEALRGKFLLIEFWASWCPVCKSIGEDFIKPLYTEVGSGADAKLTIVSVGVNFDDTAAKQARYAQSKGYAWAHVHDEGGEIAALYGVGGQPAFVLVDPEGVIVTFGIARDGFPDKLGAFVKQDCVQAN